MYDREEIDYEVKAGPVVKFTCTVDGTRLALAAMEAAKAVRRFVASVRESIESRRRPKPPRFHNPLGVDDARWRRMNRAERRKFIKENR